MNIALYSIILYSCCRGAYGEGEAQIFRNLITEIFIHDTTICLFYQPKHFNHFVEQGLILSGFPVYTNKLDILTETKEAHRTCGGYILNLHNMSVLQNINKSNLIFKPHKRLVVVLEGQIEPHNTFLETLTNQFAIDVITVTITRDNLVTKKITVRSVTKRNTLLEWTGDKNAVVSNRKFRKPKWRPNFGDDFSFTISAYHCPPLVFVDQKQVTGGTEHEITKKVFQKIPVRYEYDVNVEPIDYKHPMNKSRSNRALQKVLRHSQLAVCGQDLVTVSKYEALEPTYPTRPICHTFLVRKPRLLPADSFMFQPFQLSLWMVSLAVLVFASVFFTRLINFYNSVVNKGPFTNASQSFFYMARLFTQGAVHNMLAFRLLSVRLLITSWLVWCFLIASYYSGGLNLFLQNPRYEDPVESLEDMVANNIRWVYYNNVLSSYPEEHQDDITQSLIKLYTENRTINSAVYTSLFDGFVQNDDNLMQDSDKPKYKVLTTCFNMVYMVFPLKRGSPFTKLFERVARRVEEHGISDYWREKVATTYRKAQDSFLSEYEDEDYHLNIDMSHLRGAFYLLFTGYAISFVVFIVEKWHHRLPYLN